MRRWMLVLAFVGLMLPGMLAAQDGLSPFDAASLELLIQARSDLELLANDRLAGQRPPLWSGSLDIYNPELARALRLDLELLAGTLLAPDERPAGWFGPTPGTSLVFARDIRHDLELLADAVMQPNIRPVGWVGGDPLLRCDRAVQSLVSLLERGGFVLIVNASTPNFCAQAELEAAQYAATNPALTTTAASTTLGQTASAPVVPAAPPGSARITGELALGFLNRYATEHIGLIPVGTPFTPVARSFTEFSRMMLIRGDGFELFIDHRVSTVTEAEFAVMPDVNGVNATTRCEAIWCKPVTYTVGSPAARRPLPPLPGMPVASAASAVSPGNRVKVPVEHLVIYYDGQDANNSTVVRMQLCAKPTNQPGNTCQSVTQVTAPGGGVLVAVGSVNGIPQFRLPYGYSTHALYAAAYFMTDVWIAAPGQKR